ncbi:hypothetical protein SK128_003845 [Halocaridina rubra]|uniref:Polynucleotide 5'-hydroxyl-kinase NOL9 n=1 Tax=Halocaridina rubra TaxID=373956 RepID=A0AAN8ZV53_HALRR
MFSLEAIEALAAENNSNKPSSSKVKKPAKRKRMITKTDPDIYQIPDAPSISNPHEREDQALYFLAKDANLIPKKKKSTATKANVKVVHVKNKTLVDGVLPAVKKKKHRGKRGGGGLSHKTAMGSNIKTDIDYEKAFLEFENEALEGARIMEDECELDDISNHIKNFSLSCNHGSVRKRNSGRKVWTLDKKARKAEKKFVANRPFYNEFELDSKMQPSEKDLIFMKKEKLKAQELVDRQNLACSPSEIFVVGENKYVIVFPPQQSLYFHGVLSVQPLVGRVNILGYRVAEMEKRDMFSLSSHALLYVKGVDGHPLNISLRSHLMEHGITHEKVQSLIDRQLGPVIVLRVERSDHPLVEKLSIIGQRQLNFPKVQKTRQNMHGALVTIEDCDKYYLTKESVEWLDVMESISLYLECGNAPRIVLCGGKGVGKSTLFKYVVNRLLSRKGTRVQCLDLDPGQAEMSLPSCVSLTLVTEPLLGPNYAYQREGSSPDVKQIMFGSVNPQFGLQRYISAVKRLIERSKKFPECPLVVNTMGWTIGTGLDLTLDIIRTVSPSHVIQIQSSNARSNFEFSLTSENVSRNVGGVCTKQFRQQLYYSLTEVFSLSSRRSNVVSFSPKLLRELSVSINLSDILRDIATHKGILDESEHMVIVKWPDVVLHVCGPKVPRERILQVLNGNLIALCHVNASKIESFGPDLPKHLIDDLDYGQCQGWGLVRGIDPLTKELHILTALPSKFIAKHVNAIIMPELHLPDKIFKFINEGGEGPYYQRLSRTGGGRLKVGRQIKPSMPLLGPRRDK